MPDSNDYSSHYSEKGFWEKVGKYARVAGERVIYMALVLYYAVEDQETPAWAKAVVFSALGYFILPADAIPDLIPVVGYADDLGVLSLALAMVAMHITPEAKEKAKNKMKDWFGELTIDPDEPFPSSEDSGTDVE